MSAAVAMQSDDVSGYKQTELGLIPEDWDVKSLDELCSMKSGETITSTSIDEHSEFPCYGGNGLRGFTSRFTHEGRYALIGRQGALCGNVLQVSGKFFASEHAIVATSCKDIDIKWLSIVFDRMNLNQYSESSAQPGLSVIRLLKLQAIAPQTKAEQEAIAEVLSDADALIESLEQLITKKRHIKSRLLEDLVTGRKRLPKYSEQWVGKHLGSCAALKARIGWQGLTTAEYLESGDYFLITGTEFKNGWIDWSKCHYVEKIRYDQDRNIQVRCNDVLVTKDGTIGKVAIIKEMPAEATLNSGVFVIRPINNSFEPDFFYYVLRSSVFEKFLDQLAAGSTINHLYQKDFVNFVFKLPPAAEQNEITKILKEIDNEIDGLESKLNKAKRVKQGMMQNLLTGKVRLI